MWPNNLTQHITPVVSNSAVKAMHIFPIFYHKHKFKSTFKFLKRQQEVTPSSNVDSDTIRAELEVLRNKKVTLEDEAVSRAREEQI